ncbi:electron transport complex subunit RsxC [Aggregatibacter aphrophilus]|uniref:Ion-translocating oxidoreductase complex subunit C n=2 Tax=Aggregatibacter aphrophilus TaxID=732 RepID=A0A3S4QSY5_AGGAP|nr:electron transport complex subunit RsxC [Aggregatibacter aphrophilus]KNE85459.1 electron transporter RnfC [Aggregatibacter aphrophilus ATCC 33389]RDE88997.1 electron transport complex subunit RsxC [Aggregatibacter aphrophilus]VEF44199.1 Nitrogen fixation protein rnfC [Aggregatibacter aphrophilus ATCC 33389]
MADVLTRFNSGKLWEFDGGIHPPDMKSQSNKKPISTLPLPQDFYVPIKQHTGSAGSVLVKRGDHVLKGQPLTQGDGLSSLPVHAPTSGTVIDVFPYVAAHPSGLPEISVHIKADGLDQWREQNPMDDFLTQTPEQLVEKIYQAGIAGLGGAVFPTAAKIHSAEKQVKLLIINGAECEPYITCDDRLMRDYADEIIEGIRIIRYILRPEKVVIAVEDNKLEAVSALERALHGANDIEIRIIPTKYPSGAAKQLIQVLTGMEVPSGQRSSSIGVLMQNVGTAFAVKRAVINDEPLIERVVTLTGDKIPHKGNYWARFGTPIYHLLQQADYQYDERFPVFMGGPMMGFILPDLNAPLTKVSNCLLAPDHFEYAPPEEEKSCIRCSACSDACPVKLMPQQLYWFARSEDHEKAEEYSLKDCIECGICAYVCPSHIPLIQYFRQEKAKIWEIKHKAKLAEEAKIRFEQRQARLEREEQERKQRSQRAAAARREELAQQNGEDPVAAALERLKAKKAETPKIDQSEVKTIVDEKGQVLPDNSDIMAQRKARRLARQAEHSSSQETEKTSDNKQGFLNVGVANGSEEESKSSGFTSTKTTTLEDKKAAVAAALARAKAKKVAQQGAPTTTIEPKTIESAVKNADENTVETDPRKAAIAAAIARAKEKKAAQQDESVASAEPKTTESAVDKKQRFLNVGSANGPEGVNKRTSELMNKNSDENTAETDPRKAAIAAAIARAKAKKAAKQDESVASAEPKTTESAVDKKQRFLNVGSANGPEGVNKRTSELMNKNSDENTAEADPRKAAIAAAIARAKAKKAAQQDESVTSAEPKTTESAVDKKQRFLNVGSANGPEGVNKRTSELMNKNADENTAETDPRKAAIAAAIARAKAKKAAQQAQQNEQH